MINSKLSTQEFKRYLEQSIQNYVINAKDNLKGQVTYQALAKEDHLILALVFRGHESLNLKLFNQAIDQKHWQVALKLIAKHL